jgi:uncharacterized protein (UPF0261 family)
LPQNPKANSITFEGRVLKMAQKGKNIVIIGTMDTKAEEALYLKELIERRGHNALVMDLGIGGEVPFQPDFPRDKVALATGRSLEEIRTSAGPQRYSEVLFTMAEGATKIIRDMSAEGKVHGLLSIGGSLGTSQALATMRALPLDFPKMALSTVAFISQAITSEMVSMDQAMMQSVADLWGINRITRMALQRAAGAICGMAETQEEEQDVEQKPLVGITCLGVHHYVDRCKALLQEKGYEPVVFHSVGSCALERLIEQGYFSGVLDLSAYELVNYVCGGLVKGGEIKFTVAGEKGIPQVIGPGAMDFFPLLMSEPLSAEHQKRRHLQHAMVNLVKSTPQEQEKIATLLAEKVNKAKGPTAVLVPLEGFSRLDRGKEAPFYEPGAGRRFMDVLEQKVSNPLVKTEAIEAHINDPAFAERATALLLAMYKTP